MSLSSNWKVDRVNTKQIAVIAVVIVIIVAAAAVALMPRDGGEKKGGLYTLDADVVEVTMGGITASPKIVDSIESLYSDIYGDLVDDTLTIEDAMADTAFWDKYCTYEPMITDNGDGTFTVVSTDGKNPVEIELGVMDKMISTSTIYLTTIYYLVCMKYGETPYSEEALANEALVAEYQRVVAGGTTLDYIRTNTELRDYFDADKYIDGGANTLSNYETETLAQNIKDAGSDGSNVVLIASGGMRASSVNLPLVDETVRAAGGQAGIFLSVTDIPEAFASIELLGYLFGYGDYVEPMIQDLQERLYKIYYSLQNTEETHKIYWETYDGTSVRLSGMSGEIVDFFGWDDSLVTGGEVDTETILMEKPDILIFYTNDQRSDDEKMRA